MTTKFLPKLSQNYIELLANDEYYDVTIEIGEDPNVKILRAHMNILSCRSPYLRRTLAFNNRSNNTSDLVIKLPNISLKTFQIILKYIYGGVLSLNEQDNSEIFEVLLAADKLLIQELVDYLQKYLIENKSEWMEQHFELVHRTSFQSNSLLVLQQFCTDFMVKSSEKIFKLLDFTSLSEKSLIQLIKRNDLQMKEIEVWEHVLKWGLAQNPTLNPDPTTWSDDEFETMEKTLQHCLHSIRFFSLSSKDFLQSVRPYKKLLKHQLYEDLLKSYLDPNSNPTNDILLPRNLKIDGIINSSIINNLSIISTISRRLDKMDISNNFAHLKEPYKFKLILRGSRDGFTPKKFHELCDGILNTVTFIKVEGTEEILGGYNPLKWESSNSWGKSQDSFIFSFKEKDIKSVIISNIKDKKHAFYCGADYGPDFGDIIIFSYKDEYRDYKHSYYQKRHYEKKITDIVDKFSIEDYEVFQIIK
ncbi:uncharacterized protein OCT59_025380 [Rhizophagus irregularis]|uniref:Kelch-like protein 17 n=2 Tax=Rhizophagus irregularis TaxID=588596 RepID=A0A015J8K5_RHIIW|nr:hypothetical protein RirG_154530 [Rhizophagus irregularis DAOM 197198w]UZO05019.1 hypothetical protein OCT59_025380 [Rhizophagus irregularis]